MNSESLKQEIRRAALSYAQKLDLPIDDSHASAVLFLNLADNFHPKSFANIMGHPDWQQRTTKRHQVVLGLLEMQSSNSSDALLMNIFCHPDICRWKGVEKLGKDEQRSRFSALSFSWIRSLIPSLLRVSKKSGEGKDSVPAEGGSASGGKVPQWLEEIIEAHTDIAGSEEFVEGLKEDFFSHRVFVFTPNGDVVDLPYDSTPIDFAYAIHSDLGNHLQGAKVNGKLVSFDTKLDNGAVVEIIRRDSARPSPRWLEIARTSLARRHIRAALGMTEQSKTTRRKRKSVLHRKTTHGI